MCSLPVPACSNRGQCMSPACLRNSRKLYRVSPQPFRSGSSSCTAAWLICLASREHPQGALGRRRWLEGVFPNRTSLAGGAGGYVGKYIPERDDLCTASLALGPQTCLSLRLRLRIHRLARQRLPHHNQAMEVVNH